MADLVLEKSHTALLVADFYADAMGKLPHALQRNCIEKTVPLLAKARSSGILVCYSATVFRPGYVEVHDRNKIFRPRKYSGQPAVADPLALIHKAVAPAPNEPVVGKHRVNAMFGTDLQVILNANEVHTLILLGFATSGVVLSTTRYAADADYRIIIVEDCCADRDAAIHDFLCSRIFPHQAEVVQSEAVIQALAAL